MRVCVVGAGAIGGLLGTRLALAGADVSLVARGPHLNAIQWNGIEVHMADGSRPAVADIKATSRVHECGCQDLVIIALKAHQIEPLIGGIRTLLGPRTMVLPTQSGIPWWYFQRHGGEHDGYRIKAIDPRGVLSAGIESERIIGCVSHAVAEVARPGVIRHIEGCAFPVGELDGARSARVEALSELLVAAGFESPVVGDIRCELWLKAWSVSSFSPISALTHATLTDICEHPLARDLVTHMMLEAREVAGALGIALRPPLEQRIASAQRAGKHKTSMLKDVEVGKALEVDALLGAVVELGDLTGTPAPHMRSAYAMVKLLERTMEARSVCLRAVSSASLRRPLRAGQPELAGIPAAG